MTTLPPPLICAYHMNNQPLLLSFVSPQVSALSLPMFFSVSIPFQGFPNDPRYSNVAFPIPSDVSNLSNNEFLNPSLIKWIIHHMWFLHSTDMSYKLGFYVDPIWLL